MSDIALNSEHDLDVTNQELSLVVDVVDDPEAIKQEMSIAMQFHRGEWPLNVLVGIPFLTQVFVKNPSIPGISSLFSRAARSVDGIVSIESMEIDFDSSGRSLAVDYRAKSDLGTLEGRLAVVL